MIIRRYAGGRKETCVRQSRIEGIRRRLRGRSADSGPPFVPVGIACIQAGIGEHITVGRIFLGVDEARGQDGSTAAVGRSGVRKCLSHGVEVPQPYRFGR